MILNSVILLVYKIKERILRIVRSRRLLSIVTTPPRNPPTVLGKTYVSARDVSIGDSVTFYPGVYLWGSDIVIGDHVDIGINTIIYSCNGVHIGHHSSIAAQCYIIDSNHSTSLGQYIQEQPMDSADEGIYIGNDVWIAAQCTILKGAKINDGAVIGANSLVNSEIPANAIAFGTPARVHGYRS